MSYKNHSWRRWWFWRSNSSMQRMHTSSWKFRFQNLCSNSRTNYNWTSSSNSYHTTSWHQWNWNSNSIHDNAKSDLLGSDLPRVYTHSVSHAHFSDTFSVRDAQTPRTRSAYVISLQLTLSILMFHPPSLLFPHGHFETTFLSSKVLVPRENLVHRCEQSGHLHPQIRRSGLIAGWRESKEGRQTVCFTPLNPIGDNSDEQEPCDDFSKLRKVHSYSKWKTRQDAVYWINLARAQDKGLRFWQSRSHAVIVYSSVPADCIYKVISEKGERIWFERLLTPRPAPKIVLKITW